MTELAAKFGFGGGFPLTNGTAESNSILPTFIGDMPAVNSTFTVNRLYAAPFFVPISTTIDGLAFENTGTGNNGHNARLGIYNSTTGGLPGTLIDETGAIALDTTRDVRIGAIGGAQTLLPTTKYWIAIVCDNNVQGLGAFATAGYITGGALTRLGVPAWNAGLAVFDGTNYLPGFYVSHPYGALPSSFGTPTAASNVPFLGAQVQ